MLLTYEIPIKWITIDESFTGSEEKYITSTSNITDAIKFASSYIYKKHIREGVYGIIDESNIKIISWCIVYCHSCEYKDVKINSRNNMRR